MTRLRFTNWFRLTWHPSEEELLAFLDGELSKSLARKVQRHLEGCWSCRAQREKVERSIFAFIDYRSAALADKQDNRLKVAQQLGSQYFRRERAPIVLEKERAKGHEWPFAFLAWVMVTALFLVFLLGRSFLWNRPPATLNSSNEPKTVAAPSKDDADSKSAQVKPIPPPSIDSSTKSGRPARPPAGRQSGFSSDLLAQAQRINLRRAAESTSYRAPNATANDAKTPFKIVASSAGPTLLRIALPANSKEGRYAVSIRDTAFVNTIVSTQGRSRDREHLFVPINLQHLKAGKYVMLITRHDPATGGDEYVWEGYVRIIRLVSASRSQAERFLLPKKQ